MQHFIGRELVAASRSKHRIEHHRHIGIVREDLGDGGDIFDAAKCAYLERIDRHVLEQTARLIGNPFGVDRLQRLNAERILNRDRRNDGKRMTAHACQRQQIGLNAGAAGRIRGGKAQHQRRKCGVLISGRHFRQPSAGQHWSRGKAC